MLLVNGKRKEDLPKLAKAVQFNLVSSFTFADPRLKQPSGKPYIRKNQTFRLPTVYTRFNKVTNQTEEWRYAVREIPISTGKGEGTKKYLPDRVVYTETKLIVTTDKPDLYEFLMNSPWLEKDGNEKIFSDSYKPLFYVINPVEDSQGRLQKIAQREKAISMILGDVLPEVTLRRLLTSISGDGDAYEIDVVKDKLVTHAEADPKAFLASIGSKDTELKALISELREKDFIKYDGNSTQWQWGSKTKEAGKKIVQVPSGKNESDWLIDTLLREDELLKSFKLLSKETALDPNTSDARKNLILKAKALKCAQGYFHMSDEGLAQKINKEVQSLKAELDNAKTSPSRKSEIEGMLEATGELVKA